MPVDRGADDTPERVLTGLERDFGAYLDFEEQLRVAHACLGSMRWRAPPEHPPAFGASIYYEPTGALRTIAARSGGRSRPGAAGRMCRAPSLSRLRRRGELAVHQLELAAGGWAESSESKPAVGAPLTQRKSKRTRVCLVTSFNDAASTEKSSSPLANARPRTSNIVLPKTVDNQNCSSGGRKYQPRNRRQHERWEDPRPPRRRIPGPYLCTRSRNDNTGTREALDLAPPGRRPSRLPDEHDDTARQIPCLVLATDNVKSAVAHTAGAVVSRAGQIRSKTPRPRLEVEDLELVAQQCASRSPSGRPPRRIVLYR